MSGVKEKAEAWKDFWARQSKSGAGGCLPDRWRHIEDAQRAAWRRFAEGLAGETSLLDLATGDGRLLSWMIDFKEGIRAVGVDLAPTLPPPPPGAKVYCGIAMEELPFAEDSFDAVTSQFGFEYGDQIPATTEIARVLRPGGQVGLMVHRGDGPILQHNIARLSQIAWVLDETDLLRQVRLAVTQGTTGLQNASVLAAKRAREGAETWGHGSAAWEIPEAIRRTIVLGSNGLREKLLGTLDAIEMQARNEISRIESLAHACENADDREALLEGFQAASIKMIEELDVNEPSGRTFASFILLKAD